LGLTKTGRIVSISNTSHNWPLRRSLKEKQEKKRKKSIQQNRGKGRNTKNKVTPMK
jgi:hypothetical protein